MKTTSTKRRSSRRVDAHARREAFTGSLKGMKLIGEVVCWNKESSTFPYATVRSALKEADLDPDIAKALLPEQAFTRAAKHLKDGKVIDNVKEDGGSIKFQLTAKFLEDGSMKYKKETDILLLKGVGRVECLSDPQLAVTVQDLLDKAIEERTTGDITKIFTSVLSKETDVVPFSNGTYIIPSVSLAVLEKLNSFFEHLGGGARLGRLPIPSGTDYGDKTIQESMESFFQTLVNEHLESIKAFTVTTRADTLDRQADKIKESRMKAEAYSLLLREKSEDIMKAFDAADEELIERVEELTKERDSLPPEALKGKRVLVFGHPATSVIRWLGRNGFRVNEAESTLKELGFDIPHNTFETGIFQGRKTTKPVPELTTKQVKEIDNARKRALAAAAK